MKQIATDILAELDMVEVNGNNVKLVRQLDRKTYLEVNKVLEALGGKWNKKQKVHLFEADPREAIEEAVLTGQYEFTDKQKDFGFFETPLALAKDIIALADIHTSHSVLEPSAGRGALLAPMGDAKALREVISLMTVELLLENAQTLRQKGYLCKQADFLTVTPIPHFDRIVMNPPFAKQVDIDHVTHAIKFLRPGGRLVAIMSAGVRFRENKKTVQFRDLVEECGAEITANPDGSFKDSGTMVNTVTVVLDK